MASDEFVLHQRTFRSRIAVESMIAAAKRQRGHLAGAGGSIPTDYSNYFDRKYPAARLAGGQLENLEILARKDQIFSDYATDWEKRWSSLVNPANRFIPVLDEDFTVVGHYGEIVGCHRCDVIIPQQVAARNRLPGQVALYNSIADMLACDIRIFIHSYTVSPPAGWERVMVGSTEENFRIITNINGEVMCGFVRSVGFLESPAFDPIDLIDIGRLIGAIGVKIGGKVLKTLMRKTVTKEVVRVLDGPTIIVAKEAAEKIFKDAPEGFRMSLTGIKLGKGYDPRMGIPPEHLDAMIAAAKEANVIPIFRANKAAAIPWIRQGAHGKPMWAKFKTSSETGILTAKNAGEAAAANMNGYYVVGADGIARKMVKKGDKMVAEVIEIHPQWKPQPGQVYAPDGKPVVGDYDLLGVAPLKSPGRNINAVPDDLAYGDWTGPDVKRFLREVNKRMDEDRVLHGAQDGYGGNPKYMGLTDDTAYAVFPDGSTYVMEGRKAQEAFYAALGRQAKSPGAPKGVPDWTPKVVD